MYFILKINFIYVNILILEYGFKIWMLLVIENNLFGIEMLFLFYLILLK